jgi:multidrug efflux pump subunit AcrA (membrane-fusion protein)
MKDVSTQPGGRRNSTIRVAALLLLGTAGAGGSVLLAGARSSASDPQTPKAKPATPAAATTPQVMLESVAARVFDRAIRVTGTLKSDEVVALSSKATGLVRQVLAKEGDRVRQGQLLVQIDDSELRAQRDKARAAVRSAQAKLQQAQTSRGIKNTAVASDHRSAEQALATARTRLSQAKSLAQISATSVEADVDSARANLEAARERLKVVQDGSRRQEKARAELAVTRAQTQANKLQANLARREQLFAEGAIAREDVDNVRRDYEGALAEVNSAKEQLDLISEGSRSEEIRVSEQQVRQAEATLRSAEANRARRQISDEDVDAAEAQVRQSQAAFEATRAALAQRQWNDDEIHTTRAEVAKAQADVRYYEQLIAQTRIFSPVNAVVTQRKIHVGESVSATSNALMTLVATDTLYFEATAPEGALPYLHAGGCADVTLDALPGQSFAGTIREIIPVAEGANRSVRLRISLPRPATGLANAGTTVVVGGFARATVRGATQEAVVTVPSAALVSDNGEKAVYVYEDGRAQLRDVEVGASDSERAQILDGLHTGDRVIVSGAEALTDGQQVRISTQRHGDIEKGQEGR